MPQWQGGETRVVRTTASSSGVGQSCDDARLSCRVRQTGTRTALCGAHGPQETKGIWGKDASPCLSPTATRLLAFDPAGCRGLDQPPARRRLVPPTRRDELRDSVCAQIAAGGRGIGPAYPTRRLSAGSAAPTRRGLPGRRQFEVADDLSLFRSVAVAKAARATRRSSPPPGLGTNRRTCHPHAEKDRRHP